MKPNITLTPWVAFADEHDPSVFSVQSVDINKGDYVATVFKPEDARFITAAPEMFAALEMFRNCGVIARSASGEPELHPEYLAALDAANAAVAKATGGNPSNTEAATE